MTTEKEELSPLLPGNYSELPKEAKKTNDSVFDRIFKVYHNSNSRIQLTAEEERKRIRWEHAWFLLVRHQTLKQVVDVVMKSFGVSRTIAYDDVRNAMMLFGNPQDNLKEAKRSIAETMVLRALQKCWANGDMEMYHRFLKEYKEINKLDTTGDEGNIAELLKKMKPTQIIIVATKDNLEAEANKLQEDLIKDIPHSLVDDENKD